MRIRAYKAKTPPAHQASWTKSQRDAFYYGYVAGVEMSSKRFGWRVKTDLLGNFDSFDPISLRRKLNYFCLERRIGSIDKPFYWNGVQVGVHSVECEQKEKHPHEM